MMSVTVIDALVKEMRKFNQQMEEMAQNRSARMESLKSNFQAAESTDKILGSIIILFMFLDVAAIMVLVSQFDKIRNFCVLSLQICIGIVAGTMITGFCYSMAEFDIKYMMPTIFAILISIMASVIYCRFAKIRGYTRYINSILFPCINAGVIGGLFLFRNLESNDIKSYMDFLHSDITPTILALSLGFIVIDDTTSLLKEKRNGGKSEVPKTKERSDSSHRNGFSIRMGLNLDWGRTSARISTTKISRTPTVDSASVPIIAPSASSSSTSNEGPAPAPAAAVNPISASTTTSATAPPPRVTFDPVNWGSNHPSNHARSVPKFWRSQSSASTMAPAPYILPSSYGRRAPAAAPPLVSTTAPAPFQFLSNERRGAVSGPPSASTTAPAPYRLPSSYERSAPRAAQPLVSGSNLTERQVDPAPTSRIPSHPASDEERRSAKIAALKAHIKIIAARDARSNKNTGLNKVENADDISSVKTEDGNNDADEAEKGDASIVQQMRVPILTPTASGMVVTSTSVSDWPTPDLAKAVLAVHEANALGPRAAAEFAKHGSKAFRVAGTEAPVATATSKLNGNNGSNASAVPRTDSPVSTHTASDVGEGSGSSSNASSNFGETDIVLATPTGSELGEEVEDGWVKLEEDLF